MDIMRQHDARHYLLNVSNADIKALNRLLNAVRAKAEKISPLKCMLLKICSNMSGAG